MNDNKKFFLIVLLVFNYCSFLVLDYYEINLWCDGRVVKYIKGYLSILCLSYDSVLSGKYILGNLLFCDGLEN